MSAIPLSRQVSNMMNGSQVVTAEYLRSEGSNLYGIRDRRTTTANNGAVPILNSSSQTTMTFNLQTFGSMFYENIKLHMIVNAPTVATAAGTNPFTRLCNAFGLFHIASFQLWYGGKMVSEVFADDAWTKLLLGNDMHEWNFQASSIGYMTSANRDTAASGQQEFFLELDEIISLLNKPLPRGLIQGGSENFYLQLQLQPINSVVETNGTGAVTCTFAKYELFYTLVNSTPEIDKSITAAMNTGLGINMYQLEALVISQSVSSATQTIVQMPVIQGKDVPFIVFYGRPAASQSSDLAYTTFSAPITSWNIMIANRYVSGAEFDITTGMYYNSILKDQDVAYPENFMPANDNMPESWTAGAGNGMFIISYCNSLAKQMQNNKGWSWTGSKYFDQSDVALTVNYGSSWSGTLYILIYRVKPTYLSKGSIVASY